MKRTAGLLYRCGPASHFKGILANWEEVWVYADRPPCKKPDLPIMWKQGGGQSWSEDWYADWIRKTYVGKDAQGRKLYEYRAALVKDWGCAMTVGAMGLYAFGVQDIDPGRLNSLYIQNHLYGLNGQFHWGVMNDPRVGQGLIKVETPVDVHKTIVDISGKTHVYDGEANGKFKLSHFHELLQDCKLIAVKVFNPNTVAGKSKEEIKYAKDNGNHWVFVIADSQFGDDYMLADPGRGLNNLGSYGRVYRYVVFGRP